MIARAGRFWRTVRHLRPIQIYGRVRFRLTKPHIVLSPAPALRAPAGQLAQPARRAPRLLGPTTFSFLGVEGDLWRDGWDGPQQNKLWRYNQHYFDDLTASGAQQRDGWHRALLADWIAHNPPGKGTGWEPYPVSLRIVNLVKWALSGNEMAPEALDSLALQARWLVRRLEWHLLGNHLFANAKALMFAGAFFDGAEAASWLERGCRIIADELPEQFLPDGGHFELSTMYHALAVEDLLDLLNLAGAYPGTVPGDLIRAIRDRAAAGLAWLDAMSHPDGAIAFFNDAAFGIAASNQELAAYAARLGIQSPGISEPLIHLPESGYARLQLGAVTVIADLARIGPDHLPGHAHADTLSFELSFGGRRVFVNSGTSEYGEGPERQRQRGTPAHNTVTVAHENSSEIWAGFRVGRRAYPIAVDIGAADGMLFAAAGHNGYSHLKRGPHHHRRFSLTDGRFTVEDVVAPACAAQARYHLHPEVAVRDARPGGVTLLLPGGDRLDVATGGGLLAIERNDWHPEFGVSLPNECLVLPLADGRARLELRWT